MSARGGTVWRTPIFFRNISGTISSSVVYILENINLDELRKVNEKKKLEIIALLKIIRGSSTALKSNEARDYLFTWLFEISPSSVSDTFIIH